MVYNAMEMDPDCLESLGNVILVLLANGLVHGRRF